jgi:hypothetical protein
MAMGSAICPPRIEYLFKQFKPYYQLDFEAVERLRFSSIVLNLADVCWRRFISFILGLAHWG